MPPQFMERESRGRLQPVLGFAALLSTATLASLADTASPAPLPAAATRAVDFARDIRPLLDRHCVECHGPTQQKSGFRLDDRTAAFKGGDSYSPAIRPGDSANSPLIHLVSGRVPDMRMPSEGQPLSPEQIGLLRAWIDQGAPWTAEAPKPDPVLSHWAFRPVNRPTPPTTTASQGVIQNPIDAFISEKRSAKNLTAAPEADRTTLIRRLYTVVLGVPPTPEEVDRFVRDTEPQAFERLVDRALADNHYGERWARHWLDVIRFAETNGFETNRERPNAWRFRDYVIASLNQDKPWDQFVREQIAGDAVGVDVGTGFLVGGPFDIVKSPDPVLTAQQRADELDDMVATTGTAFLGLTLGCARCHSHKFDPISQREYYAMAAVFAGVQHGDRPLPLPPAQKEHLDSLDARIRERESQLQRFAKSPAPSPGKLRPAVTSTLNTDAFTPVEARHVRFTIRAASGGEPCIDELEVWSGNRNVALASAGTRATASGTLPGYDIHRLEHINDGRSGNARSWISNESGRGWIALAFARSERIERVVWGRDREGQFRDRVATDYVVEVSNDGTTWQTVASSSDREPFSGATQPTGPVYHFELFSDADARQGRDWLADLERLRKERKEAANTPAVWAGNFSQPAPTHRLHRGDPMQKREVVPPATPTVFQPVSLSTNTPEKERRLALARWITDPGNPLTPRVIVNRLWQHHFGVGLVDTPNDFGRAGSPPSHPELLDWLASELVHPAGGSTTPWSLKHIHRLVLTSATWRQSAAPRPDGIATDAASRLLWRFPPRRMEAEAIRDGILAVSGSLDGTRGGPGFFLHDVDRENVYHYHPKEEFGPGESRRMIYAFKVRMEQDSIFGSFDCPDGSLVVPRRSLSTTPLQALNLFNSRFILRQSELFAARLAREAGPQPQAQIQRAWLLAFHRPASPAEESDAVTFAQSSGMPALCRAVLNSNEFLFIP